MALLVALSVVFALGAAPSSAAATDGPGVPPGDYPNAAVAEIAVSYLGRWGADACVAAGKGTSPGGTSGGQCKTFVNCVVWMASRGDQWAINGYARSFERVGGVRVEDAADARTGDLIQIGGDQPSRSGMQHTAIVLTYRGDGVFDVVDSNYGQFERVTRHEWAPPEGYTIWRMGTLSDDAWWLAPGTFTIDEVSTGVAPRVRTPRWLDLRRTDRAAVVLAP